MTTIYYRIVWEYTNNNEKVILGNGERISEEEAKQWITFYENPKNNPMNIKHYIQHEFEYSGESLKTGFCVGSATDSPVQALESYFS